MPIQYSILDPTGNITALVETPVDIRFHKIIADRIMQLHPEVEQVGFLETAPPDTPGIQMKLRMAGGEFCGNASMCTAFLYSMRRQDIYNMALPSRLLLQVSGAADPVEAEILTAEHDGSCSVCVKMPPAIGIGLTDLPDLRGAASGSGLSSGESLLTLPLVRMEGISHIIIEPHSPAFSLLRDRKTAEACVREWCRILGADGLGLMFVDWKDRKFFLTPLVYVPGSGTVFWENSCASGSSAAAMYFAFKTGAPVSLTLNQPGGSLRVDSDPVSGVTRLTGNVRLTGSYFDPGDVSGGQI